MKPIYQTRYGERKSNKRRGGNCFQAALASLFELALEDVPDFCNLYPFDTDEWWEKYIEWLNGRGFSALPIDLETKPLSSLELKNCILLVQGRNRDGVQHCVIYKNGEPIHNPNKKCKGITPEMADIIFPLNPAEGLENK